MNLFSIIAAGAFAAANAAEHYTPVGAPPICEVDAQGYTHVYYKDTQHPSFKCTHSGSTCACTLQHPTHHKGGCKQLESKAAGKILDTGGDCTDSGKNTPAPTPAPTPPPTPAGWAGSDLAADVALMTDGATINLAAGTFAWTSLVTCAGKTLTLTGAGKDATVLDAGGVRRFFTLNSGCTLVLRKLSLRNGKAEWEDTYGSGGAIYVANGGALDARDVEFKGNSGTFGGAVRVKGSSIATFTSCDFTSNSAVRGGALFAEGNGVSVTSCDFTSNSAVYTPRFEAHVGYGAAVYGSSATITFAANSFSGNTALTNNYGNCFKSGGTIIGSCS